MLHAILTQALTLGMGLFMMLCGTMGAISAFNSLRLAVFAPAFHPRRRGRMIAQGGVCGTDPSQVQTAPLSQTPCLAYTFVITESRGKNTKAYLHTERRGQGNLSIQTANGTLAVNLCELDLTAIHFQDTQHPFKDFLHRRSHQLLAKANLSPINRVGMRRSLTLTERILRDGDQVYCMGRQSWENQQRNLKNAIVTDKPISHFILRASVMFAASTLIAYLSIGVIRVAFR